jgi:hypothetical protein
VTAGRPYFIAQVFVPNSAMGFDRHAWQLRSPQFERLMTSGRECKLASGVLSDRERREGSFQIPRVAPMARARP